MINVGEDKQKRTYKNEISCVRVCVCFQMISLTFFLSLLSIYSEKRK